MTTANQSNWCSYEQARAQVQAAGINSAQEYRANPQAGLPARPELVYKDHGWVSWGNFLGQSPVTSLRPAPKLAGWVSLSSFLDRPLPPA